MTRRRFVWDPEIKELVEVPVDYEQPRRNDEVLWNDRSYDGLKASDGTDISSRTKHKEYMKKNGLTTADDFKETWSRAAQQRAEYYQGKGHGAVKREDIGRAIHQLENRRTRKG